MGEAYDFGPIQDYIDEQGITQAAFAHRAGVSDKVLGNMKRGLPVSLEIATLVATAAGLSVESLRRLTTDKKFIAQTAEARRQLSCIAYAVAAERLRLINRPDLALVDPDMPNVEDGVVGSYLDRHLAKFSRGLLVRACGHPDSPLHGRIHFWEEEMRPERLGSGSGSVDWGTVFDTNDDSNMSDAGLGGQGVFSLHHREHGLVVCVVFDYERNRLLSATAFEPTSVLQIVDLSQQVDPAVPTSSPQGVPRPVPPSDCTRLDRGVKLNVYLGKSGRVRRAAECLGDLLKEDIAVYPFGGARGPCLVADRTIQACVENDKGMRFLDALPALLLVQQSDGVCLAPEDGKRLRLNDSRALFQALDVGAMAALAALRRKFIAAGTLELAKAIRSRLPGVRC